MKNVKCAVILCSFLILISFSFSMFFLSACGDTDAQQQTDNTDILEEVTGNGRNGAGDAAGADDAGGISSINANNEGVPQQSSDILQSSSIERTGLLSIREQVAMFREIADDLPLDDIGSATELLRTFKALANDGAPNDDLFLEYEESMQFIVENLNSSLEDMDEISDELITNALENGFLFVDEDAYPYFLLRSDFLHDTFYDYVSNPLRELLMLRKKHYQFAEGHDFIENSTLMVSWAQLAEMIIDWENYLNRYIEVDASEDISSTVGFYLALYIGSVQIDNSGLYDYVGDDTQGNPILVLNESPKESYIYFTENYRDSRYLPIISELLEIYIRNDYVYSDEIFEFYVSKGLDLEW
ncbi:MAG: hypothetical protein FWH55_11685 [Oscillospiraceae bacterium]|nr:hypothetical protein [Oscillospiraceae bacterium]